MTQVVVVGSGIVGATIAYELSRIPGFNITLVDKQAPASDSTGAALGVLMGAISHKTTGKAWRLRERSMLRYETLIPELEALTGKQIPFNRQGILMLLFEGENLASWEKLRKTRHSQGWKLEFLEPGECPQIKSDRIQGAIYSPGDRQVNPTILTEALVAGARLNGVKCQFGVKIQNIISTPLDGEKMYRCYQIQTTAGIFDLDWLIIASGCGSTPLTNTLVQSVDIRPVLGQALHLRSNSPLGNPEFQPVITGGDVHIVPLNDKEYWVGATVEFPNNAGEVEPEAAMLEKLRQQAISFCPALADATILRTWSGKRPRPEGRPAPVIEKLSAYSNVLLATGHYRNGVLLAPATAEEIIQLMNL